MFEAGRGVDGGGNLALVRPDGSAFHLLTRGDENVSGATWTADDRVAVDFQARDGGEDELWTMDAAGRRRTLMHVPTGPHDVALAPGGRTLVVSTEFQVLEAVDLRTGSARTIGHRASSPAFAPDGALYTVVDAQPSDGWVSVRSTIDGRDRRLMRGFTVSVSPDGRAIAVVRGDWLWIANADGSRARRVAPVDNGLTTWSPDSRLVAFFCRKGQGVRVCTVPRAGAATVRVAAVERAGASLSWGRRGLVFPAGLGRKTGIWTWDGIGTPRLLLPGDIGSASWSPDGRRLVFLRIFPMEKQAGPPLAALFVADADGRVRQITHPAVDQSPSAPLNGRWIAFVRHGISGNHSIFRRYAIRPDGTGLHLIHQGGTLVWTPQGAPLYAVQNDRQIDLRTASGTLVRSYALPHQDEPEFEIDGILPNGDLGIAFTSDESTCGVAMLTSPGPPQFLRPKCPDADTTSWSPDGAHVAFASGSEGIWTTTVADGPLTTVTRLGRNGIFATTAWSPDGRFLAVSVLHNNDAEDTSWSNITLYNASGHPLGTIVPRVIGGQDPVWINSDR